MSTLTTRLDRNDTAPHQGPAHHLATRTVGAALALGVAYIHVKDQGGFPGEKTPTYVGIGYYVLEAAGLVLAIALLAGRGRHTLKVWAVTAGLALGPLVGFALSRGPGLPDYTDDKGNWTEPIGVASLIVEGTLLALAAVLLQRSRRTSR
jgi:hypothetical protein